MAKQDVLSKLPIKAAVSGPVVGWLPSDYANCAVVLNSEGVIDEMFTSSLATPSHYDVDDEAGRLALAGVARKGDTARQADNSITYTLKNTDGSNDSDWAPLNSDGVTKDAAGQIFVTASGVDQNINLIPSGEGYVHVENYLYVDGIIEADGSEITNLNASNISSGVLSDNLLSPNVALRDETNSFTDTTQSSSTSTGAAVFAGGVGVAKNLYVGGTLYGSGSGLTALSASNISSGTLGVTRGGTGITSYTTGNYIRAASSSSLEQRTPAQVRSDIGANDAGNLSTGTISSDRLPTATTSIRGGTTYASDVETIAGSISNKATVPSGVKALLDSITTTTSAANKIVKTGADGLIDSSLFNFTGFVAWSDLPGTVVDEDGDQGDVLSELLLYDTPSARGIVIDVADNAIAWFTGGGVSGALTVPTLSGGDKTWTLPNKTGTVLLDSDAVTTATANSIVKTGSGGTINANFIPTLTNITYTGQLRTPSLSSGAVSGESTSKLPIYDSSGSLRGYIPVYPS